MLFRKRRTTNRHRSARAARTTRARAQRRGTVLLIALGALGVISLAGLSYVTFVSLDRLGSTTHAKVANFQQQVDATTDWIGTLLAADLYGNKVVPSSLPNNNFQFEPDANNRVVAWPRRFEDGEFRDYPSSDVRTFNGDFFSDNSVNIFDRARLDVLYPSQLGVSNAGARRFDIATPDDAWLAPVDPVWNNQSPDDLQWRSVWSHLTNLRSAYVYVDNADAPLNPTPLDFRDDAFVRQDGRYADLGQFFLDPITLGGVTRANGGALISTILPGRDAGEALDPLEVPFAPVNTLDTPNDPQNANFGFQKRDERFMVDTDGDTYADARWQELDALGSLFGYRWVVGARIIDMSALANINSATTNNYAAAPNTITGLQNRLPTGGTPADVDLFKILANTVFDVPGTNWGLELPGARYDFNTPFYDGYTPAKDLFVDQLANTAFSNHLQEGIGFYDVVIDQGLASASNVIVFNPGAPNGWIPQSYRDAHYLNAGADPESPASPGARRYPVSEMIDLVSFWGVNQQALISRLEERVDGPLGANGYLPSPDIASPVAFGPLESARPNADSRNFPNATDDARPTANEVRWGVRRLLTTTSGAADFSPVPVLNFDARDPDGRELYLNAPDRMKVDLTNLDVQEFYETVLWSLAPLAFNEPLVADLIRPLRSDTSRGPINVLSGATLAKNAPLNPTPGVSTPALDPSFHYGGGTGAEAERFLVGQTGILAGLGSNAGLDLVPPDEVKNTGASFAVSTALQFTANAADAFDSDFTPTVLRFLPTDTLNTAADAPDLGFITSDLTSAPIELGTRTPFGEIPSKLLDQRVVGKFVDSDDQRALYFEEQRGDTGLSGSVLERLNGVSAGNPDFDDPTLGTGMTVVGLEVQPYLSEAFSLAAYSNKGADDNPSAQDGDSNLIQPNNVRDQTGAIMAFELINPWSRAIPSQVMESLEIWVVNPNSAGELLDDPAAPPMKFRFTAQTGSNISGIGARSSVTYLFAYSNEDDRLMNLVANRLFDNAAGRVEPIDSSIDPKVDGPPVFFQNYAGNGPVSRGSTVLLMRNVPQLERPVLIDVLEGEETDPFPATLDDDAVIIGGLPVGGAASGSVGSDPIFPDFNILADTVQSEGYSLTRPVINRLEDIIDPATIRGRVIVTSSLSKPTKGNQGLGLTPIDLGPQASFIEVFGELSDTERLAQVWVEDIIPPDVVTPGAFFRAGEDKILDQVKTAADANLLTAANLDETFADQQLDPLIPIPAWEVLIPDGAPFSGADLALVSKHAHICLNHRLNRFDSWRTVGQQLGAEVRTTSFMGDTIGLLDLTSSIPGFADNDSAAFYTNRTTDGTIPSEQLSIPLALRLFDAVEALKPAASGRRFNGRVNINTASQRVLEALPWVAPWAQFAQQGINPTGLRARAMMAYRDGIDPQNTAINILQILSGDPNVFTPDTMTNLSRALLPTQNPSTINVRRPDAAGLVNGDGRSGNPVFLGRGFASTAELAILDSWNAEDNTVPFVTSTTNDPFTEKDPSGTYYFGRADLQPGFVREMAVETAQNPLSSGVFDVDRREHAVPRGGQAERIALYRALSNIVETRSDVYGAWFVIRGYDPNEIEAIDVDTGDPLASMEDARFSPAYESRWFVLFDRSNVDSPTDRPEILLQVELPSQNP